MTIPARNIRSVFSAQSLRFNNHVFQDFINRMTDMNFTVCIRWAIVQNKLLASGACLTDFLIQADTFPTRQHLRLALGQIATHRKFGIGQIQRRFVLAFDFIIHS